MLITFSLNLKKLLGLIGNITFTFSTLEGLLILHFSIVGPTLEYAFIGWNSITSMDVKNLEGT
jgi:hypothetical protein